MEKAQRMKTNKCLHNTNPVSWLVIFVHFKKTDVILLLWLQENHVREFLLSGNKLRDQEEFVRVSVEFVTDRRETSYNPFEIFVLRRALQQAVIRVFVA